MTQFKLKLLNLHELDAYIGKELTKYVKKSLNKLKPRVINRIKTRLRMEVMSNEIVKEVGSNTDLWGEIGIPDIRTRISKVVDEWTNDTNIVIEDQPLKWQPNRGFISGGFTVYLMKDDYTDVLDLSDAKYESEKGFTLKWLEWLLTSGNNRVVIDYDFKLDYGQGRTGKGVMIEGFNRKQWMVPQRIQCSPNQNFATQAVEGVIKSLEEVFNEEIEKSF